MTFGADKRAQSTLVGFILLFGILVIAFSSYQAFVVPNQNAEVEFNHNQQVQTDMQELRNSFLDVRSVERIDEGEYEVVSEHRPVRVRTGTQYPARLVALNPPAPSGNLQASDPGLDFTIENAEVTNPDAYDGDPEGLLDDFETGFETRFLSYRPEYNEYQQAPRTGFEHSLLYNEFDNADLVVRNQRLINEKRLNVVLFSGDPSPASGRAVTLDPETLDGPTAPVSIEAPNGNIEFTIPTDRPELWASEDVIGEAFGVGATHARVVNPEPEDDRVTIELEAGETYQLRAARVGFDGGSEENEFTPVQLESAAQEGGESAPSVYDTSWSTTAMETANIFLSGDTLVVEKGEIGDVPIDGVISVVDAENSDPIAQSDVDFGSSDEIVADLVPGPDDNVVTDDAGDATAEINIGIGSARLFAASGDSGDRLPIDVRANIEGVVSDANGDPIPDATVEIEGTGITDTTNAQGEYTLIGIAADTYDVTADADEFESETVEVDVSEDEADNNGIIEQNFDLEEEEDPEPTDPPEFNSITVTSSGQGQNNNQLTFEYDTTDDATGMTLFAQTSPGNTVLVNDGTAPTDSGGETYTFGNVNMNQQNINIEMTVENADGDSRTCTGTITNRGGSLSLGDMNCQID